MIRTVLFFFLLSLIGGCKNISSHDYSHLNSFFFYTKSLDHGKAKAELNTLTLETSLINELKILNKLLSQGVQGKKDRFGLVSPEDSDDLFLKCIRYLNLGYYELYFNPDKRLSYEYFYNALEISRKESYMSLRKLCLMSLLEYYHTEIARNDKSYIKYLNEFEEYKSDEIDEIWNTIYNLIFQTAYVRELDDDYYDLANRLDVFENSLGPEHPMISRIYFEKALRFELKTKWEDAKIYYQKAFESSRERPNQSYISFSSIIKIAEYHRTLGHSEVALKKLLDVEGFLNPNDSLKDRFYISKYKASYLKDMGECCNAFEELEASTAAGYELDFRINGIEISRLQVQLDTQKKELENTRLKNQLYAVLFTLILGATLAILIQKNTTKKRKLAEQEAMLEQQKVEALLKEQELTSIDAMIAGQEKERTKVANELHDDLGSLMATVKLHFDNVKVNQKDPALMNAQKLLDEAYQKIRGMAHSKNSGVMANQGLLPAVKKMTKIISETNTLKVSVEDFGLGERMENSLELTIFRMIQELMANIIKHAEATKATIQFTQHEDNLNIIVEDNGKGFDMAAVRRTESGMGLGTIEKRIEHLEGSFTVDSVRGKGTSILIDIPV